MQVWMEITTDEYQLPVAIADSAHALSLIVNTNMNNIKSCVCHAKRRLKEGKTVDKVKYIVVDIGDDDEE